LDIVSRVTAEFPKYGSDTAMKRDEMIDEGAEMSQHACKAHMEGLQLARLGEALPHLLEFGRLHHVPSRNLQTDGVEDGGRSAHAQAAQSGTLFEAPEGPLDAGPFGVGFAELGSLFGLVAFGATAPLTGLRMAWLTVARWTAPTEKGLADTLIAKCVHLEYESGTLSSKGDQGGCCLLLMFSIGVLFIPLRRTKRNNTICKTITILRRV
jgi:hypothetical protein